MKRIARGALAALAAGLALAASAPASAQLEEDLIPESRAFESPELFAFEFRIGPYSPEMDGNPAFDLVFDDNGPLIALELDIIAYRLPDVLYLLGGGGI